MSRIHLAVLFKTKLMADMDLWSEDSKLSNFADDTQSIIIRDSKEDALEATRNESRNIITKLH